MNKTMNDNNDAMIARFLKENSARPADDGFTRRVMQRLPQHRHLSWDKVLQYICYAAAALALIYFGGRYILHDVITAPTDRLGFFVRILKDGIYVSIVGFAVLAYTLFNAIYSEDL